jgi:hypothetical protein
MRILALAVAAWLAPPGGGQDDARLAAGLKDLESPEVRTVYRAVARLAEFGEGALRSLEAHQAAAPARVRPYVELAIQEIRAARLQPLYPRPKLHSLKSADKTAADLLVDLKSKSGLPLSIESLLEEEKLPELNLELRDATALEALDAVCKAGGLTLEHPGARFEIYPGGYPDFPKFFYDHYLFRLETYARTRSVTFRKPLRDRLRIDMAVLWDPSIAPVRLRPAVLLEAVDDLGKNLLVPPEPSSRPADEAPGKPDGPAAEIHPAVPEGASRESLEILPPGPKAAKIARLRGLLPVVHPKARVELTFEKPAAGQKKESAGFEIAVTGVDREHCAVDLFVASRTLKLEELRALPVLAALRLKGQEAPRCVASAQEGEGGLRVRVEFENVALRQGGGRFRLDDPRPAADIQALHVAVVTQTVERKVPFEFRDVTIR